MVFFGEHDVRQKVINCFFQILMLSQFIHHFFSTDFVEFVQSGSEFGEVILNTKNLRNTMQDLSIVDFQFYIFDF